MVESKRAICNGHARKGRTRPRVIPQTITIDTPVPSLPKPQDMLSPPDAKLLQKDIAKLNADIRKCKEQLVNSKAKLHSAA